MSDVAYDPNSSRQSGADWVKGLYQTYTNRRAGGQLARGDSRGAASTLFQSGNIDGGRTILSDARTQRTADRAEELALTQQVLRAARTERDAGRDVGAALQGYRGAFQALGSDVSKFDNIVGQISSNPALIDQLDALTADAIKWELRAGGNGDTVAVGIDGQGNTRSRVAYAAPRDPIVTPNAVITPPNRGLAAGQAPLLGQAAPAPMAGPAIGSGPLYDPAQGQGPAAPSAASGGALWRRQEQQESGGRQFGANGAVLTSPAGAFGVAQLMPGTAAELAPRLGVTPEQLRRDPDLNRRAGQLYMDDQLAKYGGNPALALAAYNAGPGRVDEWIQRFGDPRTGEITTAEFVARIPFAETKQYVQNITGGEFEAQGDDSQYPAIGSVPRVETTSDGYRIERFTNPADERAARNEDRAQRREERLDRRAEVQDDRAARDAASAASARTFTQENQLRGQLGQHKAIQALETVRPQIGIIGNIARRVAEGEQVTAQDDLALIFSFMKVLDPGSVVREGEFANAQNTGSIPDRVWNAYNNAMTGERLNDRQRNEFFRTAARAMEEYDEAARAAINRTRQTTSAYGLNPDRVAPLPPRSGGDGSPRLRFQPTEAQTALSREIVASRSSQGRRGERTNPILINPADPNASFANVPRGGYFITPDGQLRGPKP